MARLNDKVWLVIMLDIQLTHEEQQRAVEKIQELMAKGINSGEAIQIVARELRELYEKSAKNTEK